MKKILFTLSILSSVLAVAQSNLQLIKDITPGEIIVSSNSSDFISVGDTIYFLAEDELHGRELWKSDGTETGTVIVKDIFPGKIEGFISNLINVNGTVFFLANDGVNGKELWTTDGTEAGTMLLKDIFPGNNFSTTLSSFIVLRDTLYFKAYDGFSHNLWKSDGTVSGTLKSTGVGISSGGFFAVGDYIYYENVGSLHRTDGSGTSELLKTFTSLFNDSFTAINDTIYFNADDGVNGVELWKSDGTASGTVLVKDINAGSPSSFVLNKTVVDGKLFFSADDGVTGRELWVSDGTSAGTVLVKDIDPTSNFGVPNSSSPDNLYGYNDSLYFLADDGTNGKVLWKSDGNNQWNCNIKKILQ